MTAISKRRHAELAGQAMKFVAELLLIAPLSPDFGHQLDRIAALGREEIALLAARQAAGLALVAPPPTDVLARAIAGLRSLAAGLEPLRAGNLGGGSKRWGLFPARPDPAGYFRRYRAQQGEIEAALAALARARDGLIRANVTIAAEQQALGPLAEKLAEHALLAEELAQTLTARAEALAPRDPVRAQRLSTDALFAVQSRARDIAEARALMQQALALRETVTATNARLIEGIDQAIATMVMVLKTAIAAARIIAQQVLVLDGIASLGQAARNLIADSPAEPDRAAALQSAFVRLYDALDRLEGERAACADLTMR